MSYKNGDPIFGRIYKGREALIDLRAARINKNEEVSTLGMEVFEFESTIEGGTLLKEKDKCRLVNGDSEIELEVISVATGALPFSQIYFRFTQSNY